LTVYGDGSQTRSLCYVDDMIDAFIRLMDAPEGTCDPVNLGNPHEVSMLELAEHVRRATRSDSEIVFRPLPIDDPWHRQPDISAARALLDWSPTTSLDAGLSATADHFRARLAGRERAACCDEVRRVPSGDGFRR
jgi:UDP-glucuronate decarboxylase